MNMYFCIYRHLCTTQFYSFNSVVLATQIQIFCGTHPEMIEDQVKYLHTKFGAFITKWTTIIILYYDLSAPLAYLACLLACFKFVTGFNWLACLLQSTLLKVNCFELTCLYHVTSEICCFSVWDRSRPTLEGCQLSTSKLHKAALLNDTSMNIVPWHGNHVHYVTS